jgi:serine/threonine-protein kinase HipA
MTICPITLNSHDESGLYSRQGLREVHPQLSSLDPLAFTAEEQLREARRRADKMSIPGVQPKLSAILSPGRGRFEIVDRYGKFILKPNPPQFEEVPANEALTMRMARAVGIEVPAHGLLASIDGGWIYFVKRFDREGRSGRIHLEDFAQLSGATRETKYDSSLEQVVTLVERFCSFPALEKPKLAKRLLFCYLTGNEDMHLKNFSLIVHDSVVQLSPAYDLLNTTLVLENAREESALPMKGKKKDLSRKLWTDYLLRERMGLREGQVTKLLGELAAALPKWRAMVEACYLSDARKQQYLDILQDRCERLQLR